MSTTNVYEDIYQDIYEDIYQDIYEDIYEDVYYDEDVYYETVEDDVPCEEENSTVPCRSSASPSLSSSSSSPSATPSGDPSRSRSSTPTYAPSTASLPTVEIPLDEDEDVDADVDGDDYDVADVDEDGDDYDHKDLCEDVIDSNLLCITVVPSVSASPSSGPSSEPSYRPSSPPSNAPGATPSSNPTSNESAPSMSPSHQPSTSNSPSTSPSHQPSTSPSHRPSTSPSEGPSSIPSSTPTVIPSVESSRDDGGDGIGDDDGDEDGDDDDGGGNGPVPQAVIDKFIKDFGLVETATLVYQQLSPFNTFTFNGKIFSLDDAEPFDLVSPNAIYSHNAVTGGDFPEVDIVKIDDDEDVVTIRRNSDGEIKTIFIVEKETGKVAEIQSIYLDYLATVASGDYDEVPYLLIENESDVEEPLRRPQNTRRTNAAWENIFERNRNECVQYNVLELAVAYESSFCAHYGGTAAAADEEVISLISVVSSRYQQKHLCVKVVLSHLDGHCDPSTDPYRESVQQSNSGCLLVEGPGLLPFMRNYWNANKPTIERGIANLFSGSILECNSLGCVGGCAYKSTTCEKTAAYGVLYATFKESAVLRSTLVAHEMGHNNGAQHVRDSQYIMNEVAGEAPGGFSNSVIAVFNDQFSKTTCVMPEVVTPSVAPSEAPSPGPIDDGGSGGDVSITFLIYIVAQTSLFLTVLTLSCIV